MNSIVNWELNRSQPTATPVRKLSRFFELPEAKIVANLNC
jgi:hypothetical protein